MKSIEREQIWGVITLAGMCLVLSLLVIIPFPIKPNVYVVCLVVGSFVIDHVFLFGVLLLGIVWWLKYVPYATPELIAIGAIGVVAYSIRRALIRDPHPALIIAAVSIAQGVFWLLFSYGNLFSWLFVIELFYNILLTLIVYGVWIWVKKIFI